MSPVLLFYFAMAFAANYKSSLSHQDLDRYNEKVQACRGVDPYELVGSECSDDVTLCPKITEVDRIDYFVYQTEFVTKNCMKCLKSLEAHNFFTSGFVSRPQVKELDSDLVVVLGKVRHSQSLSLPPLKSWVLAKKAGEIVTGHCTCMAGRGEACSHMAAIVFMLEYAAKVQADVVGTDQLNAWLPPTIGSTVPKRTIADIDFTSTSARIEKMQRLEHSESQEATPQWITDVHAGKSKEAVKDFFQTLRNVDPKLVVLSTLAGETSDPFIPPQVSDGLPKLMSELYDETAETLPYEELLERCQVAMKDVCRVSEEEAKLVEEKTRGQASSASWYKFRRGRITASNMKSVCAGDPQNPAISTINKVCYGGQQFSNKDTERGRKLEKPACKKYAFIQKKKHQDFKVSDSGLVICQDKAYLAASPDSLVSCSCCDGEGCVEIKCPNEENMMSSFDAQGNVLRNHQYFYQMQTQMYVCGLSYCDFFVYSTKRNILQRVYPDQDTHEGIVEKCQVHFLYVILPELIAKYFSLHRLSTAAGITDSSNRSGTDNICYCQTPRRDPMIICAGKTRTFKEFHCRCVGLTNTVKRKWWCPECKK